jgi:tetratricopeptide (TPR) repeat protein
LGRAYRQQGRSKDAIQQLERAVELRPNYVEAYMQLSQVAADMGNQDRAEILLNKALKLAQRDALAARVLIQRGNLFRTQEKYGAAIDDFNRAISLDPRNLAAYIGLGETYRDQGEPEQAIDRYRAALLLDGTYVDAHVKLGNAYYEAGRFDEALASYQRATELQPQTGWLLLLVGDTFMDLGQADEALGVYQEALAAQPSYEEDPGFVSRLASVYQAQGLLDDALASAEQAEQLAAAAEQSIEGPLQLQADILSEQERWQAAIDLYTKVLEINPKRAQAMRGLALAYEAQGRSQEAVAKWRAYLQQAPKGDYVDEAREHLRRLRGTSG